MTICSTLPSVNDVVLAERDEVLLPDALRQRACAELLRQSAINAGLLDPHDPPPVRGVMSEAASDAIEALLARELVQPEPDEASCLRYYQGHPAQFTHGERIHARHVLFAVTPGVDVSALRQHAEACLIDVRSAPDEQIDQRFAHAAATLSNCPSAEQGGDLGWLAESDCAPEFARDLFGGHEIGVLPRLVHSRFGLHVVEILDRVPGSLAAFESVRPAVVQAMQRQGFATALRQYLQILGAQASLQGVDLDVAGSALVQ